MPLSDGASALIRANLEELQKGNRVRLVEVGVLTDIQLGAINRERHHRGYPALVAEVVFIGRHVYESRIVRDCYTSTMQSTRSPAAWEPLLWCSQPPL